ncbi:MAG: Xaa-Pro aminopeptidase [Alteromonadaceae bacterium]|jgi:Xaa-Pro aminopeptidase
MITIAEFAQRRERFMAQMDANSMAIFPAASEVTRSRDTEFPFRQDSDFHYLCGFAEPDAVLVFTPSEENKVTLFCRPKDKEMEIWTGRRVGPDKAVDLLAIDCAHSLLTIDETLLNLINGHQTLYYSGGVYSDFDQKVTSWVSQLRRAPKKGYKAPVITKDARTLVDEMRLFKSDQEIEVMSKACQISSEGHKKAMQFTQPGVTEYQVEAQLHHHFAMNRGRYPAYGTIVGGGNNANILHYTQNSDELKDGDLLLIDSGCELDGYAADITRTFPVNGRFSAPQAELYQLVLDAQLAALALYTPGKTLKIAGDKAIEVITQGLVKLGLLTGEVSQLIEEGAFKAFYMHGLGHWLGLDVHDVGDYRLENKAQNREFEPGMVLTVEPGLYVDMDADVPAQYKGIGIRIEDDILITKQGHRVLTCDVPKTIKQIEALMAP